MHARYLYSLGWDYRYLTSPTVSTKKVENISIFLNSDETTSASFGERLMSWKQPSVVASVFTIF